MTEPEQRQWRRKQYDFTLKERKALKSGKSLNGARPALGSTQPPTQWEPGALSPGVKRPGHEADHSPPTSAEFKNIGVCIPTPKYAFKEQCLISYAQGQLYDDTTDSACSSTQAVV
jgi:hypothetical protein